MASRITQSFSFHRSPESFISDRLQNLNLQQPHGEDTPVVRAEILNRNVHIISSYQFCKEILSASHAAKVEDGTDGASSKFAAGPAYQQLMEAFFPHPNILLEDGMLHAQHKSKWKKFFEDRIVESSTSLVGDATLRKFVEPFHGVDQRHEIDLYETMKQLVWDLLLGIFLGLSRDHERDAFKRAQEMQEKILVGQFSLFPLPLRTPFWTSPRSHGLKAVQDLGPTIRKRLKSMREHTSRNDQTSPRCPLVEGKPTSGLGEDTDSLNENEIVSHVRLFTSSIANKALSSLLTAFLLNLFIWRDPNNTDEEASLAKLIATQDDATTRTTMLHAVLKETERLSPPVIGIMRRATESVTLDSGRDEHTIQAGHDTWLYFVAANRDPGVFQQPDTFQWDRYMGQDEEESVTFGLGSKQCLGADLSHQICLTVAQTFLDSGISFHGNVSEGGVKQWLGWQSNSDANAMARDVKQLPCQRPRRPVMLTPRAKSSA